MNEKSLKSLDRALSRMERRQRRGPRRFPLSALSLTLGLVVCQQLLGRLIPIVWRSVGRERAWETLGPFRQRVWLASAYCQGRESMLHWGIAAVGIVSLLIGYRSVNFRRFLWLCSVAVMLANAAILFSAFWTGLETASRGL